MKLTQMLEALLIVAPILGVLILIVFLIIRKQNKLKSILENSMTQAQKDRLLGTRAMPAPDGRSGFVIEALVVELQDKGEKVFARLIVRRAKAFRVNRRPRYPGPAPGAGTGGRCSRRW